MKKIALTLLLITVGNSANAQWEKIADFISTDGTVTFNEITTCVYFLELPGPPQIGFVGTESELHKTTNGGKTWYSVCDNGLYDICFKDSLTGWFITNGPYYCYKTTDGGESWNALNVPDSDPDNPGYALYYIASTNKLLVNVGPLIWVSTDLGSTWSDSLPYQGTGRYSFWTQLHGIVPVSPYPYTTAFYLETEDGALTWDTIFPIFPPNLNSGGETFPVSGTSICFMQGGITDTPVIIRSDDYGRSWSVVSRLLTKKYYYQANDTSFIAYTGIIAGDLSRLYIQSDTGIFVSTDSGYTWNFDGGPNYKYNAYDQFYAAKGITIAGKTLTDAQVYEGDGLWEEEWPQAVVKEQEPSSDSFQVMGPYENPSVPASNDVSMLVHYCGPTSTISAQVYTMLGTPVGVASTITSDGQEWDKLPINSPSLAGSFYIVVTVGLYSSTLGYTVY